MTGTWRLHYVCAGLLCNSCGSVYGAMIERTYKKALNGYAVEATAAEARRFAADPAVTSVVQNRTFTIAATQPSPPSWGLDRIDQAALPLNQSYTYDDTVGEGVTAYVIDTAVRNSIASLMS